jgi:phosphoglycerate dehydrogenase-like enzyme
VRILLNSDLSDRHCEQVLAVSPEVELVRPASREELLEQMPQANAVFGSLDREMFLRAERLQWVQTWGAGVDGVLFKEFVESEVVLTSAKGTVGVHLADHAMALLLSLTRGIVRAVREPGWGPKMDIRNAAWELVDRTMGIVGLGGTGRELATRASAFGLRVIAVDPEKVGVPQCVDACWGMDRFSELLSISDIVAICAPLTTETSGLFDQEAFRQMRSHALLINVTRGGIVDEVALVGALKEGEIGGAGLDVTPQDPLPADHPLWDMPNVVITPHVAGGSPNRQDRIVSLICENLKRLIAGLPLLSEIDKRKGY